MNVLVIGKFYMEGFALHIAETLSGIGHVVRRFEPGPRSDRIGGQIGQRIDRIQAWLHSATANLPAARAPIMRRLWKTVEKGPLDFVIVCHDFLWPEEVTALKQKTGAPLTMWFPDALVNFGSAYFMTAPYDAVFFKDPYIVAKLGDFLKSPVFYLPESFNPKRHWLPDTEIGDDPAFRCDIALAGNLHSSRIALCKNLLEYDLKLWGKRAPCWMNMGDVARMYQGRAVYNHDKVRAFRGAKIVLNNLHHGEIWGVNTRTFEAAGAGAFQFVDWRPSLSQLFVDGEELISFQGLDDLKRKIATFLQDEGARKAIAAAGMRRAFSEHTYELRLKLLIETVMGGEGGYPKLPGDQWG